MSGGALSLRERFEASQLGRRLRHTLFRWTTRDLLATPPLVLRPAPVRIVSMVSAQHVHMYLLAIKAFYRHLPGGSVTALDDGTLTAADHALLRRHVPGIEVLRLDSVATDPCPRGGCWERLLFILDRSAEDYVVQLDSDVLTTGPIPEVLRAIEENAAFTLNSGAEFAIQDFEAATAHVAGAPARTLQGLSEQALAAIPADAGLIGRRYVRGSAGFAGFPRGGATRDAAAAFSRAMEGRLGARWHGWGSEQVASNHVVASLPAARTLPWPRYVCFYADTPPDQPVLFHFLGSCRFEGGVYAAKARAVIGELSS